MGIPLPAQFFFTLISFVSPQPCLQLSLMPCIMADQRFEFIRSGTHIPERDLGVGSLHCVMPGCLSAGSSPHTSASGILSCAGEIFTPHNFGSHWMTCLCQPCSALPQSKRAPGDSQTPPPSPSGYHPPIFLSIDFPAMRIAIIIATHIIMTVPIPKSSFRPLCFSFIINKSH